MILIRHIKPLQQASILLTDHYHVTKHAAAANCRAVPSAVSELFLALDGAETHSVSNGHHGVWRRATHVALLRRQPGNTSTDDVSFQSCHDAGHHPGKKKNTLNVFMVLKICTVPAAGRGLLLLTNMPAAACVFTYRVNIFLFHSSCSKNFIVYEAYI